MARPLSKRAAAPALDRGLLPSLLGYALRRAQSAVFADFSAAFAQAGEALTPGEFGLMVLVERNAGLSQTALARALDIDRSTLVPILDRLQGRELLVRRPSPTDGRTHALVLTPLGTRTLAQFSRLVRSHERRIARGLSSDEMHLLIALLEKVRAGVSPL
jgi:DNA-binding MarR family transcriptional regulator